MEDATHLAHGFDGGTIRRVAARLDDGAGAEGCQAGREAVIAMLDDAPATGLPCVLRYKRHYCTVSGPGTGHVKAGFLEHAQQGQDRADCIAERIVQLNGSPDFNPATLTARSHAGYDDADDVQAMIRADLFAERVAITSYRQMHWAIGDKDPTTSKMLTDIMAVDEEHADDMHDLLA